MTIPKIERLLNLTAALLNASIPLTVDQICARVEGYESEGAAFRRQFERDKEDLREMGVPIAISEVPGTSPIVTGYKISGDDYYLPDPGLTAEELAALRLASRTVQLDGQSDAASLWKLGGRPTDERANLAEVSPAATLPTDPNLEALFSASTDRRPVTFSYRGSERCLEPLVLSFQRGRWYVSGFDVDQDETRVFRLDRIEGDVVVLSDEPRFDRVGEAGSVGNFDPWRIGGEETETVRVHLDRAIAASVVQEVGAERVVERFDDGGVDIELAVSNPDGFRSWVLGFGDRAEVCSPPAVRDELVEWLSGLAMREAR